MLFWSILLEQGYHITIIDEGGAYQRLRSYMGGKYYEYTAKSKMIFNPFCVPRGKSKNLTLLYQDGLVKFSFKNILVPDSATNEPLSHGFV